MPDGYQTRPLTGSVRGSISSYWSGMKSVQLGFVGVPARYWKLEIEKTGVLRSIRMFCPMLVDRVGVVDVGLLDEATSGRTRGRCSRWPS